ncbi:MAG: MFS transporter [Ferrimicrobium sp.]
MSQNPGAWRTVFRSRNLVLIFSARISMSVSRAIAGISVPLYLAALGFSALKLGILYLVVALVAAAMSSLVGFTTNRYGAKTFMIIVPALVGAAGVAYSFSHTTSVLFIFAALGSYGRGSGAGAGMVGPYMPAESLLVASSIDSTNRNRAFSIMSFASTAGALLGTGIAALTGHGHVDRANAEALFRISLLATALFASTAAGIAIFLHDVTPTVQTGPRPRVFAFPHNSRWLLYRLWVTNTLNGAAVGMFGPFITYWLYRRFQANQITIAELFLVVNVATLGAALVAPWSARTFGTVRATSWLRIVQGLLLIPMAISPTFMIAGAIYLVRMFAQRVALPLRQSYVIAMAGAGEQARVAALSNLPSQLAMAAAPTLTGYLFDNVSLVLPFEIGGVIQTVSAIFYYVFFHSAAPPEERHVSRPAITSTDLTPLDPEP